MLFVPEDEADPPPDPRPDSAGAPRPDSGPSQIPPAASAGVASFCLSATSRAAACSGEKLMEAALPGC